MSKEKETVEEVSFDLVLSDAAKLDPIELFQPKIISGIVKVITSHVTEFEPDTTTAKGRKEIASFASKVSKSKTFLDGIGKELVGGWKAKAKVIDAERKTMRDALDDLKVTARKPLTDWEEEQAAAEAIIDEKRAYIETLDLFDTGETSFAEISERLEQAEDIVIDDSFGDYRVLAEKELEDKTQTLDDMLTAANKRESEQAELAELREKNEAREKKDKEDAEAKDREARDEEIRQEAADKAVKDADDKAKADQWAADDRAADTKHRGDVTLEAINALMIIKGMTEDMAGVVVSDISQGHIPHITINY